MSHVATLPEASLTRRFSGEGRDYLSVKLDDSSFPAPIYAILVEGEETGSIR